MPKTILQADARVPELPKVRFIRKNAAPGGPPFTDVTNQVARLDIEALEDGSGMCALQRRDAQGAAVWRTLHPSIEETRWQAKFEYGVDEADWREVAS